MTLHYSASKQQILLTGGTGFIGQALCRALLKEGHALTLYVRNMRKAARLYGESVRCITSFAELEAASVVDVVINLAGEPVLGPRWTVGRKADIEASRSGLTQDLVACISGLQRKPRLMISASAIGYYGVQAIGDATALTEGAPGQPIFMSELCQHWERSARAVESLGVPLVLLRLGVVLGGQGALPKMLMSLRMGVGVLLGSGQQMVSWIHIDDVLNAIAHLMRLGTDQVSEPFNLTAPQSVTHKGLMKSAARIMKRHLLLPVPAFILRALLGEQAGMLVDGQNVYPARLLQSGYRFQYPDIDSALRQCLAPAG